MPLKVKTRTCHHDERPFLSQIELKAQQSLYFLAQDMFPRFLNSRFGLALVKQVRAREIAGEKVTPKSFDSTSAFDMAWGSRQR